MKSKSYLFLIPAVALTCATIASPVAAQFAKPEDAIRYRQSVFTVMGTHFGRIAAMAQGKVAFDAKAAADNATVMVMMSKLPYSAFIVGSDKGGDTKAKPEIWTEREKFNAAATKMQDEVAKLDVAAKAGNFEQIKTAVGATGKSCKGCHDDYKQK